MTVNKSKGYAYSGSDDIDEVAWYEGNSQGYVHFFALKKPNELGLYDMTYVVIGGVSVALLSLLSMVGFDLLIRRVRRYDKANYSI